MTEEEKERFEASEKIRKEAERIALEKQAKEREEAKLKLYTRMADNLVNETIVICFPHTMDQDGTCPAVGEIDKCLGIIGIVIGEAEKIKITPSMADEVSYKLTRTYRCDVLTLQNGLMLFKSLFFISFLIFGNFNLNIPCQGL